VILVGEMRDLDTISLALPAAETGHLVFGTLHTQSAPKTVDRIVDVFPPEQQKLVRMMFSESFQAIICQALLRKRDGHGRVAAMEIMLGTPATRSLIREAKTHQLSSIIQTSAKLGMQSLDQNLKDLVMRGVVSEETALEKANNPEFVKRGIADAGGAGAGTITESRPSAPSASSAPARQPSGQAMPMMDAPKPPAAPGSPGAPGQKSAGPTRAPWRSPAKPAGGGGLPGWLGKKT